MRLIQTSLILICAIGFSQNVKLDSSDRFRGCRFLGYRNFSNWTRSEGESPGDAVSISPEIDPGISWDELVVSWNAQLPATAILRVEVRAIYPEHATKYYVLGIWSGDRALHRRESVKDQKDEDGDVLTDTLAIKRPGAKVQLRVAQAGYDPPWKIGFIGLVFSAGKPSQDSFALNRTAWGKEIGVPERSQLAYKGGEPWCSPASTSMVMAHWSRTLMRPELDRDVPEVASNVFDPNWPGTGNWPFNTAYAGSFPGMRAYVTRMSDVSELEDWIITGVPVILSVLPKYLHNSDSTSLGHLIVCVGFTKEGDVIANDPWARLEKGQSVRRIYARKNLIAAWAESRNTVYLIYPDNLRPPKDRFHHWAAK